MSATKTTVQPDPFGQFNGWAGRKADHQHQLDDLHRLAAHKALDIPPSDEMGPITTVTDNRRTSPAIDWKAIAALGGSIIGTLLVLDHQRDRNETSVNVQQPAAVADYVRPDDSAYEVRFYDADGNLIDVPHISTRPNQTDP